jgi:protein-disulfide isomerase
MKQFNAIGVGIIAAAVLTSWTSAASAVDTEKLIEYYRRKGNIPPSATVEVKDLADSPIKGAKSGKLAVGGRSLGFLVSDDGRYAIFGDLEDLTVDPFKAVMEKISLEGRPFKGSKDAKVTIVEYSDFQCPFCKRGYDTVEKQVLPEYGDKVRFVYKHFPLGFHPWAQPGAVAVECAADQNEDAYWAVYTALFEEQKQINVQNLKEKVEAALEGKEIDKAKFDDCFDNKKTAARVANDMKEGQSVGVSGTPAFLINGRLLSGAQPFAQFKAVIDDELSRAGGN